MSTRRIENTIPVLPVQDLERSVEFFRRTLGFELDWKTSELCSVVRDGCSIMLQRNLVLRGPTKQPWAYEMKIADPDGNTLWLGTDPDGD